MPSLSEFKESFMKFKYPIAGIGILLILTFLYNKFKKQDDLLENKKKKEEIIQIKKDDSLQQMIKSELQKLNKSLIKLNPGLIKDKEKTDYYNKLFKKEINKKGLLIDSISIPHDDNHNTSNYKVDFGSNNSSEVYKNVIGFRLVKATLPHVAHQVNDNNNQFRIFYDTGTHDITLTNGSYTFVELGNHIEDKLNTIGGASFTVNSDSTTYKYTISESTTNYFLWNTSYNSLNSTAYRLFGALRKDETASDYSSSRTFPHVVDQSKHFVDLVIPEIPAIACKTSPNGKQIIDRIPLTSPSGSLVYYLSPVTEYSSIDYFYPMKLSSLTIQLYDNDSNQLYDSQNGDNYFEFEITLLNDTSKMN
jgi:hypothetical protein